MINTSTQMVTDMVSSTQSLLTQIAPALVEWSIALFLFFLGWQIVKKYLLGGTRSLLKK